ncbi:MAG: TIGR00282 family metallophosphoesterase [Candidatus Latescibacteria bacterium]|nr:TIGR00282 family metallophosphoesterase [Candidatus Latescibacterota bacterium]
MRILFVADVFGRAGRRAAALWIPRLREERQVDLCIVNGENAAGGFGLTERILRKFHHYGADIVTSGNHIWDRQDFLPHLDRSQGVLRPLNYPEGVPGRGAALVPSATGVPVGVVNLQGRTHLPSIDCPFRTGREAVEQLKKETPVVFVDFHAEATAEKVAMGWYLDGLASAVVGTHTHVQTADERILPQGTAYLTDAGMTGPHDSVIGIRAEIAIQRFMQQVYVKFKPAEANAKLSGVLIDINPENGRASNIERLQLAVPEVGEDEDGEGA